MIKKSDKIGLFLQCSHLSLHIFPFQELENINIDIYLTYVLRPTLYISPSWL